MQRISVTARLNRSTLQFEEAAYARLESYLAEAARTLDGNPDQQEILGDLEQAVADQCMRRARPDQAAVTLAELEPALEEIGSVQVPGASTASEQAVRTAVAAAAAGQRGRDRQRRVPGARAIFWTQRHGSQGLRRAAAVLQRRRDDRRVLRPDAADAVCAACFRRAPAALAAGKVSRAHGVPAREVQPGDELTR